MIPDEGKQSIVGDVKGGGGGGGGGGGAGGLNWGESLFFSDCSWGRFWPLPWLPSSRADSL